MARYKGILRDEEGHNYYPHCYQEVTGGGTQAVINAVYPVGAVYISVNSTNPSTLFGGTWVQIQDKFLLSAGDTYTNGSTGGSATHTHTTGDFTLGKDHIPSHTHTVSGGAHQHKFEGFVQTTASNYTTYESVSWKRITADPYDVPPSMYEANGGHSHTVSSYGSGGAHNHGSTGSTSNMPPYLVVYMWKRTA